MHMAGNLLSLSMVIVFVVPPLLQPSAAQPADTSSADAAAIKQFDDAIDKYLALRRGLGNEVAGPVKDSTSTQLNDASNALAGAIQRARANAKAGAIFSEPVAAVIKRRVAEAVRVKKLGPVLANIDDEKAADPTPKVHLRLPVTEQLATMPPSLLAILPPLPKQLEYRIVGRNLVLRDVDASLVLDYILAAVPR
jgi:hypothetical protein